MTDCNEMWKGRIYDNFKAQAIQMHFLTELKKKQKQQHNKVFKSDHSTKRRQTKLITAKTKQFLFSSVQEFILWFNKDLAKLNSAAHKDEPGLLLSSQARNPSLSKKH